MTSIPFIRIPLPREIDQISKKFETTNYYRHCVASFEIFYIYLLKFLIADKNDDFFTPITYVKWRECVSQFDDMQLHYFPFAKKHYQRYMRYYKKLCNYYSGIKQLLDLLRTESYRYRTTYITPNKNTEYDWPCKI